MSTVLPPRDVSTTQTDSLDTILPPAREPSNPLSQRISKQATKPEDTARPSRRGVKLIATVAIVAAIGVGVWANSAPPEIAIEGQVVLHTVARMDMDIAVTERGNLKSQINEVVLCEVDDVRDDGIHGTPIVWIVDNGASVSKGDLIVELDSASLQERLDMQVLEVEEENAEFIQAEVEFENQKAQNATSLAEAELQVKLAELAVQQFGDDEAGTFQIDLQAIELQIQEAQAGQLIERTNLQGVKQLYKLGYRSGGELAEARLNALRSERQLATAMSKKRELVEYEFKKQQMELEGALDSAKRAYEQVLLDNRARLAQSAARLASSREQLNKEKERLERYRDQIEKCKLYAPQDGMVAYWTGSSRYRREEIRAGAPVRPRQPILSLPNLKKMMVKTSIHESVLDQISAGLSATVRVDAFPDSSYAATVASVAVLPEQGGWLSSDTKVYETIVTIDEDVNQLKPGMTAVVEIHVDHLSDIVAVPVQAIVQVGDDDWCYVDNGGQYERRVLSLGMTNSKYVEVKDGLQPGEQLVLNPTMFQDSERPEGQPTDGNELPEAGDGDDQSLAESKRPTRLGNSDAKTPS